MLLYLDNCCFNRPYDNQSQLLVKLETEAKLEIQQSIRLRELQLAWSFMLDYENNDNPYQERRQNVWKWRRIASVNIQASKAIVNRATELMKLGYRQKDGIHIACAIEAQSDYFITTDKKILNKCVENIQLVNPIEFIRGFYDAN